jgi:flagellin
VVDGISILNATQKSTLQTTQRLNGLRADSANSIATGLRVNRVSDNPVDFYRAQVLSDRVSDLGAIKGNIQLSQSGIEATNAGLNAVEDYANQLKGIANAAKTAETAEQRDALAQQFNQIRSQIDNLVKDTSFLGTNLLSSSSNQLTTRFGDLSQSTLVTQGADSRVSALGVGEAASTYNSFATLSDINAAISDINQAVSSVRSAQASYATDIAVLNTRDNFTDALSNTLQQGVDKLVNADLNEEAATQLAAQVRSDLSFQGQKILSQGDSLILGIF